MNAREALVGGEPWGTNPTGDVSLFVAWLLAGLGFPLLFGWAHLRTGVDDDRIRVRFVPFHLRPRVWRWDRIARVPPTSCPFAARCPFGARTGASSTAHRNIPRAPLPMVPLSPDRSGSSTPPPGCPRPSPFTLSPAACLARARVLPCLLP